MHQLHNKTLTCSSPLALRIHGHVLYLPNFLPLRHTKTRLLATFKWLRSRTLLQWAVTGMAAGLFLVLSFAVLAMLPRNVHYSVSGENCFYNPMIMPRLARPQVNDSFAVTTQQNTTIAGYPVYSHTTCVQPTAIPQEQTAHTVKLSAFGIINKTISVNVSSLPAPKPLAKDGEQVSTVGKYIFELNKPDHTFAYQFVINKKASLCSLQNTKLDCDLSEQKLKQGKAYKYELLRVLGDKTNTVHTGTLTTHLPVTLSEGSIAQNAFVEDAPTQIILKSSKALSSIAVLSLKLTNSKTAIPTTASIKATEIIVSLNEPLPRDASFILTVGSATAKDGSFMQSPFDLAFTTSGGPKVAGIDIGSYEASPYAPITLVFDSAIDPNQPIADFVHLESNGTNMPVIYTISGKSVTIQPNSPLPACANFTVRVQNGLTNAHGISGNSAWAMQSRTTCQSVFSIGSSVLGRSITAYAFGSGAE